jgi:hypothetical protein
MGLKGYRLWNMGQLESMCRAPPRKPSRGGCVRRQPPYRRACALQPRALPPPQPPSRRGCARRQPPHQRACVGPQPPSPRGASRPLPAAVAPLLRVALTPGGGVRLVTWATRTRLMGCTHSLPGGVRLVTCATRTRLMGCTHSRGGCQIGYMERTGCHQLNAFRRTIITW